MPNSPTEPAEIPNVENPPPGEPGQAWAGDEAAANDLAEAQGAAVEAAQAGEEIDAVAEAAEAACVIPGVGEVVEGLIVAMGVVELVLAMMPQRSLNITFANETAHDLNVTQTGMIHGDMTGVPEHHKIKAGMSGFFSFQNTSWHTSGVGGVIELSGDALPNDNCWIAFRIPEVSADKFSSIGATMHTGRWSDAKAYYDSVKAKHQRSHSGHDGKAKIAMSLNSSKVADYGYTMSVSLKA